MKFYELKNDEISIRVCSVGAELQSIRSLKNDLEYIWQPGAETFAHHTMLLFPNPGRIAHDRIIVGGKVHPATMHGFANDMDFRAVEYTDSKILLELAANNYTRRYFPYEFRFQVEFTLEGDKVLQHFYVINDDSKPVYYCLGAHPGFYCPIELDECGDDYILEFNRPQALRQMELEAHTRLLTGNFTLCLDNETAIPLDEHFFDNGPRLYGNMEAETLTLRSTKSGRFMELGVTGFDNLCLWGAPGKMSVICIEPWIGTSDRTNTDHIWEKKPGIQRIEVGQIGVHLLTFRVG